MGRPERGLGPGLAEGGSRGALLGVPPAVWHFSPRQWLEKSPFLGGAGTAGSESLRPPLLGSIEALGGPLVNEPRPRPRVPVAAFREPRKDV